MNLYKTETIYKIYKKYPRYTVYSIYPIIYDKEDYKVGIKFLYNSTSPPKGSEDSE